MAGAVRHRFEHRRRPQGHPRGRREHGHDQEALRHDRRRIDRGDPPRLPEPALHGRWRSSWPRPDRASFSQRRCWPDSRAPAWRRSSTGGTRDTAARACRTMERRDRLELRLAGAGRAGAVPAAGGLRRRLHSRGGGVGRGFASPVPATGGEIAFTVLDRMAALIDHSLITRAGSASTAPPASACSRRSWIMGWSGWSDRGGSGLSATPTLAIAWPSRSATRPISSAMMTSSALRRDRRGTRRSARRSRPPRGGRARTTSKCALAALLGPFWFLGSFHSVGRRQPWRGRLPAVLAAGDRSHGPCQSGPAGNVPG